MDDPDMFFKDFRNWAGLPWDVLSEIFDKVGVVCLISSVQSVCQQWWKLAHESQIYRHVHIDDNQFYDNEEDPKSFSTVNLDYIALASIDRSAGCLKELSIQYVGFPKFIFQRASERSTQLKVLNIGDEVDFKEHDLLEACKRFPLLEVLHTYSYRTLSSVAIESIGHSCPNLKDFAFNSEGHDFEGKCNIIAFAIAKNMPGLKKLEMIRDPLGDDGLIAILDGCPQLEILHIDYCFNLMIKEKLKYRLSKIEVKYLKSSSGKYVDLDDEYAEMLGSRDYDEVDNHDEVDDIGDGDYDYDFHDDDYDYDYDDDDFDFDELMKMLVISAIIGD